MSKKRTRSSSKKSTPSKKKEPLLGKNKSNGNENEEEDEVTESDSENNEVEPEPEPEPVKASRTTRSGKAGTSKKMAPPPSKSKSKSSSSSSSSSSKKGSAKKKQKKGSSKKEDVEEEVQEEEEEDSSSDDDTPKKPVTKEDELETVRSMWEFASFIQFCGFFSEKLNLPEFYEEDLEYALVHPEESELLATLHVKLLKAINTGRPATKYHNGNTIYSYINSLETWRNVLRLELNKHPLTCFDSNPMVGKDGLPLDYNTLSIETKVIMMLELCHIILDVHANVIAESNLIEPNLLRGEPLGYDKKDNMYFYFGTRRLYNEEPCKSKGDKLVLGNWHIVCETLQQWEDFVEGMSKSKNADEKHLTEQLQAILPEVRVRFGERAKKLRQAAKAEIQPIKRSSRLMERETKAKEKEREEKELAAIAAAEAKAANSTSTTTTRGRATLNSRRQAMAEPLASPPPSNDEMKIDDNVNSSMSIEDDSSVSIARGPDEDSTLGDIDIDKGDDSSANFKDDSSSNFKEDDSSASFKEENSTVSVQDDDSSANFKDDESSANFKDDDSSANFKDDDSSASFKEEESTASINDNGVE